MLLRSRRPTDDDALREISEEAFGELTGVAGPQTLAMIRDPAARTVVAAHRARLRGFVTVSVHGHGAHVDAIAVAVSARGGGVGRALLREALRHAAAEGARVVRLATAEANVAALQLFLAEGFRIERRRARYYARGQDAVVMRLELGRAARAS